MTNFEEFKQLLSDDAHRVQLYDCVDQYCSQAIQRLGSDEVSHPAKWDAESVENHLNQIHETTSELRSVMALLGFWSPVSYRRLVSLHTRHFTQWLQSPAANSFRRKMELYPLLLQIYSLGLAAVSANSFEILLSFIESPYPDPTARMLRIPQILALISGFSEGRQLFQILQGRERQFTPLSEHLHDFFRADLQGVLFLGSDYEYIFDRLEVLLTLQYCHFYEQVYEGRFSSPFGRFAWKFRQDGQSNPYSDTYKEAMRYKNRWPPIVAGFFGGNFERFEEIDKHLTEQVKQLPWH